MKTYPVINHVAMKTYWGSGGTAQRILNLSTRCRWVVSFMPRPRYSRGKSPGYPLDRRLSGPNSRSEHGKRREDISTPAGIW